MQLLEDDLIFELSDDHTVVTNLFNRTLPLIRYRMNDVLIPRRFSGTPPFTRVENIVGRDEHTPVFTDRQGGQDFISPHIINEFLVEHLRRFQMQLIDETSFVFRVVLEPGLAPDRHRQTVRRIRDRLREILAAKALDHVGFEIEEVEDLPVDPRTGKFRLIVPASGHASLTAGPVGR